ncbi:hypothetical protein C8R48DRAFT_771721 [Suillus tomentosus]|nr:hypothetical protein C8R48DRAFT_771721 [Suillus tomentosus]
MSSPINRCSEDVRIVLLRHSRIDSTLIAQIHRRYLNYRLPGNISHLHLNLSVLTSSFPPLLSQVRIMRLLKCLADLRPDGVNTVAIFTPQAQDSDPFDSILLPKDLTTFLETLRLETSPPPNRRILNYTTKNVEHVDFGGEVDYFEHKWFQELPSRPA